MPGVQNKSLSQTEIEQDEKLVKQCTAFGTIGGAIAGGTLAGIVEGYPHKHVFRGKQLFFRKVGLWSASLGLATGGLTYALLRSPISKNPNVGKIVAAGLIGGIPEMCLTAAMLESPRSSFYRKEPTPLAMRRPQSESSSSEREAYSLARMRFCGSL